LLPSPTDTKVLEDIVDFFLVVIWRPTIRSLLDIIRSKPMPLISVERNDSLAVITIKNDRKLNALSEALVNDIVETMELLKAEKARVVTLRAQPGVKVWSAGHDVRELPTGRRDPLGWSDHLRILIRTIEEFPAPVIALCEGGVWGGACEVVLACDLIVATPNTTFAVTPAKLGVPYNATGLLTFLNSVGFSVLKEMVFTASPISADRAVSLGIVNYVKPSEEIDDFVGELGKSIAANSPLSIAVIKEQLRVLASAQSLTPRMFERLQGLRRVVYDSKDYEEGIRAFLEKRKPEFKGE
jgi:methylmalonyl-CoA decarboxylase